MDWNYIADKYAKGYSTYQIGKEFGVNQNTIRRGLIKMGIKLRTKSEAQSLALEIGVSKHPTSGKKRSEETKHKIAKKCVESWDGNVEKKELASQRGKLLWESMSKEDKEIREKKQRVGILKAAKFGSRAERELKLLLEDKGYTLDRQAIILQNENLSVDLYEPNLRTAIEINGKSHYEPLYGEEKLEKTQRADREKAGLILNNHMFLINVKYTDNNFALNTVVKLAEKLDKILQEIKKVSQTTKKSEVEQRIWNI